MEAVSEDYLKTVVFLCLEEQKDGRMHRVPKATGFFVAVPIEGSNDSKVSYLVTARHCIEKSYSYEKLFIRMNLKTGKFIELETKVEDWYTHDNADVAAIPISPTDLPSDTKSIDLDVGSLDIKDFVGGAPDYKFVGDTQFGKMEIQPRVGHQVYMYGLFTEHYGEERNLPIARFGNISRMPDWVYIDSIKIIAYLIEFHSWGGHSGSPVFFMYPSTFQVPFTLGLADGKQIDLLRDVRLIWASSFMGLISGHYPKLEDAKKKGDILGEIQFEINTGIAIVTPAEAIRQLLMRDDLVEARKEQKKRLGEPKTDNSS